MSFDGLPPDLQSLRSKLYFFSLKSWTPIPKMHFSINRQLKFGARKLKNAFSNQPLRRPNVRIRGPKIVEAKVLLWWLEFGARMLGFATRIGLCWKFKFFYFSCFPCCLSLLVNSKHHENDTKNNVMTTVITLRYILISTKKKNTTSIQH